MRRTSAFVFAASVMINMTQTGYGANLTTLYTFTGSGNRGVLSGGLTIDAAGNLYGTTQHGGTKGVGSVFQLSVHTNQLTTLKNFESDENGYYPSVTMVADADGNLFGTTSNSSGGQGTLFKISANSHLFSALAEFGTQPNIIPADQVGGIAIDSLGNIYGASSNRGSIFEFSSDTGQFTTILNLNSATTGRPPSGRQGDPNGGVFIDSSGNLYVSTTGGAEFNYGSILRISADTHQVELLYSFTQSDGGATVSGLVVDKEGNIFGATSNGGTYNSGSIFEISASTHQFSNIISFDGLNGYYPTTGMIVDAAGNLFGTTFGGGGLGTVYKLSPETHDLTTLVSFTGFNGGQPYSGLIADSFGNLYGTTTIGGDIGGGKLGLGTIFQLTNTGFVVPEVNSVTLIAYAIACLFGIRILALRRSRK